MFTKFSEKFAKATTAANNHSKRPPLRSRCTAERGQHASHWVVTGLWFKTCFWRPRSWQSKGKQDLRARFKSWKLQSWYWVIL